MKSVLHLMDYSAPYKGNFIPSIQNLGKLIIQDGTHLIYMFPASAQKIDWVNELALQGETIYFIDNSFFSKRIKYSIIKKVMEIIKNENVSVIHTHFVAYNYTLAFMKMFLIARVKIVGNFMNEFHPPLNKYRKFKIFITKTTFHIIIASSSAVKESITNTGICSEKIEIIYNALDTKHLQIFNRINFTNNKDQKVILMFGWTYYRKGVDIAINAVRELVNEGQNIRLVIAMAGGLDVIENEIISQLGSVPSWITLQGPTHNVASYYNSSDIFLSSSREEGFTYSVLEAAYCNPMIIASEIGGHPLDIPFISHFESGNVNQLKALIIEILEKSLEEKLKIKTMQKKYVITNYNINKWSESVLEVYSKLLN